MEEVIRTRHLLTCVYAVRCGPAALWPHAVLCCAVLRPSPYDTMEEVIGTRGTPGHGSLMEWGVTYRELPLAAEGHLDWEALKTAIVPGACWVDPLGSQVRSGCVYIHVMSWGAGGVGVSYRELPLAADGHLDWEAPLSQVRGFVGSQVCPGWVGPWMRRVGC